MDIPSVFFDDDIEIELMEEIYSLESMHHNLIVENFRINHAYKSIGNIEIITEGMDNTIKKIADFFKQMIEKIKSFFPKKIKLWLIGLDFWIIYYSVRPICGLYSEIKKIIIKIIEKIHSLKRKRKNATRKECSKKYCGSLYVFCRNGDKNTFIRKIIE